MVTGGDTGIPEPFQFIERQGLGHPLAEFGFFEFTRRIGATDLFVLQPTEQALDGPNLVA